MSIRIDNLKNKRRISVATIIPSLEEINRLKQKPTEGERALLFFLGKLNDDFIVYFQPFLNGSLPDFVILHPVKGVLVIEVKDWDLNLYKIKNGKWNIDKNKRSQLIKSPLKQVRGYKDNIYSYIQGLVEDSVLNRRKYGYLQAAVYFHSHSEEEAIRFCTSCSSYSEWVDILGFNSLTVNRFNNIRYFNTALDSDFSEKYINQFKQLFAPSRNLLELGEEIVYSKEQLKLVKSKKEEMKIKGVAGSGKTLVLAKRAVNAHIRTKRRVLILTFNITLRNFIRDKLNQVRDEFSWNMFHIDNYHNFIRTMTNEYGIEKNDRNDINLFDGINIQKYDSIFIDEIQDYKLEWQEIIKKYFLVEYGELVLFGDEKQNIYGNPLEEQDIKTVIDKDWNTLNESYRLSTVITDLSLNYFDKFLKNRYQKLDLVMQPEFSFNEGFIGDTGINPHFTLQDYCEGIYQYIHENKIAYNDIVILGRHIDTLREMEYIFRTRFRLNLTKTFEKKESYDRLYAEFQNQEWRLKEELKKIRRSEKIAFQMNRGTIKMSTIHSFKGWEAEHVFLVLENYRGKDAQETDEEIIYTGITRSKNKLLFLNNHYTKYKQFLDENRDLVRTVDLLFYPSRYT
jgi:Nuclease-related domain/AAA domain/UvrD-like helicase C-terminal domain